MSFPLSILQSGIKIANKLTVGVQSTIKLEQWISQSVEGTPSYGDPLFPLCVVDTTQRQITSRDGKVITTIATLTFIGDVKPNGAPNRQEPFDTRDRITLPDGQIGIIVGTPNSVIDPSTNRGLIHSVMLGPR